MTIHGDIIQFIIRVTTVHCLVLVIISVKSNAWNFTAINLPDDVFVWKFAVWRNRAFLAIPRWKFQENEVTRETSTFFEATWPENNAKILSMITGIFSPSFHKDPVINYCPRSTIGVEVDVKGRLWLLEVPDDSDCSARILIYDLKRNNQQVMSVELANVSTKNLRTLIVDQWGSKAFVGDPGDESIIVYNFEKRRWWKVKMTHAPEIPRVRSTDLTICRKNSLLYMTGQNTLDLFSIDLEELMNEEENSLIHEKSLNITVSWHGTKMGRSSCLFCDAKAGLHYFMTSEKASVRWDTRLPLTAESHSILLQSEDYPCITDYKADLQRNVWGLVNSDCSFSTKEKTKGFSLKSRTIKIGKYPL